MSTETLTQSIGAGGTVTFGAGTQFNVVTAASPISIKAVKIGDSSQNRTFSNVPAGVKFNAEGAGWDYLQVTSAAAQNVTIAVGTDDLTFSNNVTVSGSVATIETPAGTLADTAPVNAPNAAQTNIVPQNLNRKRVTLSIPSTATPTPNTVFFRKAGGAQNLMEVQPGVIYEFAGTYGIDVRNDGGGANTFYVMEESA